MKIKEIETDKCGNCGLIDYCGDPFEHPYFCNDSRFEEIEIKVLIDCIENNVTIEEVKIKAEDLELDINEDYKEIASEVALLKLTGDTSDSMGDDDTWG